MNIQSRGLGIAIAVVGVLVAGAYGVGRSQAGAAPAASSTQTPAGAPKGHPVVASNSTAVGGGQAVGTANPTAHPPPSSVAAPGHPGGAPAGAL
jgi:hypothetical protein